MSTTRTTREKKEKFIEGLMTLGGLLAVFLGFVTDKTSSDLPLVIFVGVLFVVTALSSYAAVLFGYRVPTPRWLFAIIQVTYFLLATTFSLLVMLGLLTAVNLSILGSTNYGTISVAIAVFVVAWVTTYALIWEVMHLPDNDPKPGASS